MTQNNHGAPHEEHRNNPAQQTTEPTMIQTLVIITDLNTDLNRSSTTYFEGRRLECEADTLQIRWHELEACEETARTMFTKQLNDADRYTVEILPVPSLELEAIAMDDSRGMILRRRAITLLSKWPSEQNLNFLKSLTTLEVKGLRSMAVYIISQVYGETHSDAAAQAIEVALKDTELEVREWAVRALGWTSGERASALLDELVNDKELGRLGELSLLSELINDKELGRLAELSKRNRLRGIHPPMIAPLTITTLIDASEYLDEG